MFSVSSLGDSVAKPVFWTWVITLHLVSPPPAVPCPFCDATSGVGESGQDSASEFQGFRWLLMVFPSKRKEI